MNRGLPFGPEKRVETLEELSLPVNVTLCNSKLVCVCDKMPTHSCLHFFIIQTLNCTIWKKKS